MEGFPPPPDKQIGQPDSNYFSFPKLRWTVCHLREFLPTEQVSRGIDAPVRLEYALDEEAIDALTFKPMGSDAEMTWEGSLSANYSDGMLILHSGKIVYERYLGCLAETGKHGAMSMTKSLTGRDSRGWCRGRSSSASPPVPRAPRAPDASPATRRRRSARTHRRGVATTARRAAPPPRG
jgi:hypothetical protein